MCFVFGPAKGGKKYVLRGESTLNLVLRKWRKTETGGKNLGCFAPSNLKKNLLLKHLCCPMCYLKSIYLHFLLYFYLTYIITI